MRHGPQLQHDAQPGPHEPRHRGHTQRPLSRAAKTSSPFRFFRHCPQNETASRDPGSAHVGDVHVTCASCVFWRHQWHETPSRESYTRPPTFLRCGAFGSRFFFFSARGAGGGAAGVGRLLESGFKLTAFAVSFVATVPRTMPHRSFQDASGKLSSSKSMFTFLSPFRPRALAAGA